MGMVAAELGHLWGIRALKWQRHPGNKEQPPTAEILLWSIDFRKVGALKKKKQTQKLEMSSGG